MRFVTRVRILKMSGKVEEEILLNVKDVPQLSHKYSHISRSRYLLNVINNPNLIQNPNDHGTSAVVPRVLCVEKVVSKTLRQCLVGGRRPPPLSSSSSRETVDTN